MSYRKLRNGERYQVESDGVTVWVNTWYCIGRFGTFGIDIHQPPSEHAQAECLFCTHGEVTRADWDLFVIKMAELYGAKVQPRHMPKRFRG